MGILALFVIATMAAALFAGAALYRIGFPVQTSNRQPTIDGLRGLLAVSVVCHHTYIWSHFAASGWKDPTLPLANQLGAGAVGLFFMVTGFLFYRTILSLSPEKWVAMMVGRFFRILPLVAVSFLIVLTIVLLRSHPPIKPSLLIAAAKWISAKQEVDILGYADSGRINAHVLWSLWQEWIFYALLIPALGAAAWAMRWAKLPTFLLPLGLIALGFIAQNRLHMALYWPLFGAGMLAYEVKDTRAAAALKTRAAGAAAIGFLAIALLVAKNPFGIGFPAFALFFACVACGNSMGGVLRLNAARVLGECSFGIYLLHGIILSVAFTDLRIEPVMAIAPAVSIVAVVVSAVLYLSVEKPLDDRGRRVRDSIATAIAGFRIRRSEPAPLQGHQHDAHSR